MVRVLYSVQITGNDADGADELEGAFIVSGGTSTTLGEVKAAWPFSGQFFFRGKLLQHGEQEGWVWLDLRDDAEVLPVVGEGEVCVRALSSHFLQRAGEEPAGISPEQHTDWRLCYAAAGDASLPAVASTASSMWSRLTGGASGPSTPLPDAGSSPAAGEFSEEDGGEGEDLHYGSGEGSGSRGEGSTALDEAKVKAKAALASAKESAKGFFGRAWKAADNLSQRVAEKLEAQGGSGGGERVEHPF